VTYVSAGFADKAVNDGAFFFLDLIRPGDDFAAESFEVYARWSPTPDAAVPEPASLTLVGLGLAGMAGRRWRKRKTT